MDEHGTCGGERPESTHPEDHACLVYGDPGERVESLVPFLETGLRDDERTVCVLEEDAIEPVRGALRGHGVDVDALQDEGALLFEDLSGYPTPGELEPAVAVERLRRSARGARLDGFARLRIAADMTWAAEVDGSRLLDYEHRANESFFPPTGSIALCLYPREAFPRDLLDQLVPVHRFLVARGDLYPNPFFGLLPTAGAGEASGIAERLRWLRPHLRRASAADRALRELERAGRDRDELLATLAHELRNPLAGLSNAAALLRERAERDPKLVRIADVVGRQTHHLSAMLDDVLELARLGRGEPELEHSDVRLEAVVRRAVETLAPRFDQREVGLELELPAGPVTVRADAGRLERAVVELLSNALSYTGRGDRVTVSARSAGGMVALAVRDTGAGIAPELLPRVFEPFVRGRISADNEGTGLGIGLAIVKRLVEFQGGTVAVDSPGRGRGTEVMIRLPAVERSPSGDARGERMDDGPEPGARPVEANRILVVEDDRDSALLLRDLLEAWGHETRVVHDGASALEEVDRFRPAVVFLDLALPRMDGLEVARRIREGHHAEVPLLVAMTGYGRPSDRERTREAGFSDHLVKPVSVRRVRELLEGLG